MITVINNQEEWQAWLKDKVLFPGAMPEMGKIPREADDISLGWRETSDDPDSVNKWNWLLATVPMRPKLDVSAVRASRSWLHGLTSCPESESLMSFMDYVADACDFSGMRDALFSEKEET